VVVGDVVSVIVGMTSVTSFIVQLGVGSLELFPRTCLILFDTQLLNSELEVSGRQHRSHLARLFLVGKLAVSRVIFRYLCKRDALPYF
jgi:hypothetical protein